MTSDPTTLVDADARARIASDLDATLIVEAAAGTGKTTALVERILSLLKTGRATLARGEGDLVAVTFTEKAAGEMKLRLRTEIERARATAEQAGASVERERLDRALQQLEAARIGTIHAFCADVLRERPVEAGIDPLFEVAAEEDQARLYDAAFTSWFQEMLERPSEDVPGIARVLRRGGNERDQDGPRESLRRAGRTLVELRDFHAPYTRITFDRKGALDANVDQLRELASLAKKGFPESWLTKSLLEVSRAIYELDRREETGAPRDYDALEAQLRALARGKFWGWKGSGTWFNQAKQISRQEVLTRREKGHKKLGETLRLADAELAACLRDELGGIVETYERVKAASGKLDFLDLLLRTHALLKDHAAVRTELQARFTHLLVDEFQDTDPLQADILLLLASRDPNVSESEHARVAPGKLFLVGDPKQSIYRFRRADVALYERIKARLCQDGATLLELTTSFRSAPSIQALVNAAFAPLMPVPAPAEASQPRSQAAYVPLSPFKREEPNHPTVIALPVPRPYGDRKQVVNWKVDESYPDAVGAFVEWLLRSSGWTVRERGRETPSPFSSQHICLLFKQLQSFGTDATRPYIRALEARRIPHVLVGGKSFHEREEIMALRAALTAIEWPDDTFSVYATLHGPFFALTDEALLAFKHSQRHLHPLRRRDDGALTDLTKPVAEALDVLATLHAGRNRRPIADTVTRVIESTRAHAAIAIWPAGEQALGNVMRLLDKARRFERSRATSFRAFVAALEDEASRGGGGEAAIVEEGAEGVRIMTVHKSKGLEFPVVMLAGPSAPATHREPSRYVDPARRLCAVPLAGAVPQDLLERSDEVLRHDREEAHRLLYVATTRARDILVVPAFGDGPDPASDSWLAPLTPILYPKPATWRAPEPGPACPPFGDDSVLERPGDAFDAAEASVKPGLHRPKSGEHRVVFWDPRALDLDREDEAGLRHERVLAKGPAAAESEAHHDAWKSARAETIEKASIPSLRVRSVTEAKEDASLSPKGVEAPVEIAVAPSVRESATRPHGKRFGILVHAILASVPLCVDAAAIAEAARTQARILGATEPEEHAARELVRSALTHPMFAQADAAERTEREIELMLVEDNGTVLEGIADLAFYEPAHGWTVVDFKTDRELGEQTEAYTRQIRAYARALHVATGQPARGVLLRL
jgi:ATP-dependent helicase/nuclease subunit A